MTPVKEITQQRISAALRTGFGPRIFRALTLIYMSCIASSRPPFTFLTASHQRPRSACPTISNRQLNHCAVSKMGRRIDPTARDTVSTEYCEKDTSSSCSSGPDGTIEVFYEDPSDEQLERARHAAKRARERVMKQRRKEAPISKATCRQDADHGVSTWHSARVPATSHYYPGTGSHNTYPEQVSPRGSKMSNGARRTAEWDSTRLQRSDKNAFKATTQRVYSTDGNPATFKHRTDAAPQQTKDLTDRDSDDCCGKRHVSEKAEKSGRSSTQRKRTTKVRGGKCGKSRCQCDECWVAKHRGSRRIDRKGHRVVDPGASSGCTVL